MRFTFLIAVSILIVTASAARALETDQFTVPPRPLADIGPQFQHKMSLLLVDMTTRLNARRADYLERIPAAPNKTLAKYYQDKADEMLSDDYLRELIRDELGDGPLESFIELWPRYTNFPQSAPAYFGPPLYQTIYGAVPVKGVIFALQSPTINMYGIYFGVDKLGHFIGQGSDYFEVYKKALAKGADEKSAVAAAVALGVYQEHHWYGEEIEGVYSNGDLAANYAGFKFFLNLTRPMTINGKVHPPILLRDDGKWKMNPAAGSNFMRVFVTEHWNEAFNPCHFSADMVEPIRRDVKKRAPEWMKFYETTPSAEAIRFKKLQLWYNEDYGRCDMRGQVLMQDF